MAAEYAYCSIPFSATGARLVNGWVLKGLHVRPPQMLDALLVLSSIFNSTALQDRGYPRG